MSLHIKVATYLTSIELALCETIEVLLADISNRMSSFKERSPYQLARIEVQVAVLHAEVGPA